MKEMDRLERLAFLHLLILKLEDAGKVKIQ